MDSADQVPEGPNDAVQREPRWRWTGLGGAAFLFAGVILPVICFAMAKGFSFPWQSGARSDYALLLLSWRQSSPFYPLLFYSMASMTLLVFSFDRGAKVFVVRLGIYTGVLLAVQYFCLVAVVSPGVVIMGTVIALVLWGFGWLFHCLLSDRNPVCPVEDAADVLPGVILLLLVPIAILAGIVIVAFPLFLSVFPVCATPWAVFAYSAMANQLVRERRAGRWQFSLAQLLGAVAWFAAWCGAWRISIG